MNLKIFHAGLYWPISQKPPHFELARRCNGFEDKPSFVFPVLATRFQALTLGKALTGAIESSVERFFDWGGLLRFSTTITKHRCLFRQLCE